MIELPTGFDSIFRYIVVVSQRAEQLIKGAKPRSDSDHKKLTLIARDDVDSGLVPWRILSQEELDARRQEIVDQYRAEVGADDVEGFEGLPIPDVLPTSAVGSGVADDDGADDELSRLQKLLGMAGISGHTDDDVEDDLDDAGDDDDISDDFDEDEILVSESEVVEDEDIGDDFDEDEDE